MATDGPALLGAQDPAAALLDVVDRVAPEAELGTREHCDNVARYALAIGLELGLAPPALRRLHRTALLHDIGKAEVPAEILAKPGPLTRAERAVVECHPVVGAEMLGYAGLEREAPVVRAHHEQFDGSGYPDGLAGEEIPLESRIVAVADAFEAMTSDRPYRRGTSPRAALAELRRCAGGQFDPAVVAAFAAVLERGGLVVRPLRFTRAATAAGRRRREGGLATAARPAPRAGRED